MSTPVTEYLIGCVVDGVRCYYSHGLFGRRTQAVRYEERFKGQAKEIVKCLRASGYDAHVLRVRVTTADDLALCSTPLPIKIKG